MHWNTFISNNHFLKVMHENTLKNFYIFLDILSAPVLDSVRDIMNVARQSMKDLRTAQLWLQCMDMIDILRTFLRSERTGDWRLHVHALHDILPYLAAAGHNLYTKSISSTCSDWHNCLFSIPTSTISSRMDIT